MCIPGLHISLGIFNKLFNLFKDACTELDVQLAAKDGSQGLGGDSFEQYMGKLKQLEDLKEQHAAQLQKLTLLTQLTSFLLVTVPAPQQCTTIQQLHSEAATLQQQQTVLVILNSHLQHKKKNNKYI